MWLIHGKQYNNTVTSCWLNPCIDKYTLSLDPVVRSQMPQVSHLTEDGLNKSVIIIIISHIMLPSVPAFIHQPAHSFNHLSIQQIQHSIMNTENPIIEVSAQQT